MRRHPEEPGRHIVDVLFVLALFGVFAASALMLVTLGANIYKHTVASMNGSFTERTAYSYITEKIRQNDTFDAVTVGELDGVPALVLTERMDEQEYCTYLYYYDGHLKELYIRKDTFAGTDILSAGQNIIALSSFSVEESADGLIKLILDTGTGSPLTLYAALRSDYS